MAGGRYRVERFLGEGAKKRVFLARDTRLDRDVAVAIVRTDGLDEAGLARVQREAEAMGRLGDHPNVVTVFDVEREADQVIIVSRFVAGGDVEARLRDASDHRLPVLEAVRIARDVARALEHAHANGVIHRDVKPGNVWLAADGMALLGDFGLAAQSDRSRLTQEGTMLGTVAYMPPEQALGRSADAHSDLYALGCTLYEMLAGRPPFTGDDSVAVIAQHINAAAVRPGWHEKRVSRELDELVLKLLAKDGDERPASARDVAEALEHIAHTEANRSRSVHETRSDETLPPTTFTEFVGRERELAQLQEIFARTLAGQGQVAMLVGEPGIGKTRLSKEFTVHAKLRGAQVVAGPCYEGSGFIPYQPFVEALREYVAGRDDAPLREELGAGAPELAGLVPEIRERFPDLPEAPALEGEAERQRLFESMAQFVTRAALAAPLVIILDDLHWADKPTLLLLLHLARRVRGDRVLLIGTYRDVELDRTHPLAETVATLRQDGLYERVLLRGLTQDGVRSLLRARSGSEQEIPEGFAERVLQETEGNPFFVEEVTSHLVEIGALRRENGQWVGDPSVIERSIPEGVREVIGHRISRLSERCNAMLTIGSAMTGGFDFPILSELCDADDDAILDDLDVACSAQVLRERREGLRTVYEFHHALIRQTIYQELSTPRRVRLHRRIAEALEKRHSLEPGPHVAELAYHYFQGAPGGDLAKAVLTSERAAGYAQGQLAYEDAAGHYARALEALDMQSVVDPRRRFDLLYALGQAQRLAGERARSRETLGQAAQVARALAEPELLARTALAYATEDVAVNFDPPDVAELLAEGLEAAGPEETELRARLLARLAIAHFFDKQVEYKTRLAEESVAIARKLGDPATLCRALQMHRFVSSAFLDVENSPERNAEIARLATQAKVPAMEMLASGELLTDRINAGDREGVDRQLESAERRAAEVRQPSLLWFPAIRRSMLAIQRGPLDEAERLAEAALHVGQRAEHPLADFFHAAQRGAIEALRGSEVEWQEKSLRNLRETMGGALNVHGGEARSLAILGRSDEARVTFEKTASQRFDDIPRDINWLGRMTLTADACLRLGDAERAPVIYEKLLPYAGWFAFAGPVAICTGPVARWLGGLASLAGHHADAVRQYEQALVKVDRVGFRVLAVTCRIAFARALVARGEVGDAERAHGLVSEALDEGQALSMQPAVEEALTLRLELQGTDAKSIDAKQSIYVVADVVETRRPDLGSHAAPDGTVTLLFSDMVGFTAMTERLGDLRAREVIRHHNKVVREQLQAHGGYEVELQGDGFLLAFGSARQGLLCAIAIQRAFAAHAGAASGAAGEAIRVRIGAHTGEALRDADKFFGKTVILAARIAGQADAGEILVSSLVRDLTSSTGDVTFGDEREVHLKGISSAQRLVSVRWR
jgi:class 3 adenylate cyclase